MNPAKSKYSPGPDAKSITLTVEADENGVKSSSEGIGGDGNPIHVQYDAKFDGKDYPITGAPNADTISVKRIRRQHDSVHCEKRRRGHMTVTSKVSKDGKTRTSTFKARMPRDTTLTTSSCTTNSSDPLIAPKF